MDWSTLLQELTHFQHIDWSLLLQQLTYNPKQPLIFSCGLFLFLFLAFSLVYALLRNRNTARLLFVTAFSYYFYYMSSSWYFGLLFFVTVSDWILGNGISKALECGYRGVGKWLVVVSVTIDLALLGYFKYTNFFASTYCSIVGMDFTPWSIFLPVGISFFTFQSLSYTLDIYRGRIKPLTNLLDYAFFVSFFPQLVAGPIIKAKDFIPQIRRKPLVTSRMFATGVFMIAAGLFKKAVISDYISLNFVDRIFDNPSLYSGIENLLALYGYCIQIYCDFSGYSDMAIGIALLLGFRFPLNFDAPFQSGSIAEFWRRWHISLSTWLRDYLYIFALGGNRKGKVRTYINNFLTMLLCGFWHGASLNFVLWGAIQGAGVAVNKFFRNNIWHKGLPRWIGVIITFHFVAFSFIFFRLQDPDQWWMMLSKIFTELHPELALDVIMSYKLVFALIAIGFLTHWVPRTWERRMQARLSKCNIIVHALLIVIVTYIVIQVKSSDVQPFIYFQF